MFLQINGFKQKQPFPGVMQKYFSEKFRKTHKKAHVPELFPLRNLLKITIFYLVSIFRIWTKYRKRWCFLRK